MVFVLGAPFVEERGSVGGDAERSRMASFVRSVAQDAMQIYLG